ncbi:MAG: FmdB family zinc ribbon protein, partial [Blastocatellia bacterium]
MVCCLRFSMDIVRADFPINWRAATSSTETNSGRIVCAREIVINSEIGIASGAPMISHLGRPARGADSVNQEVEEEIDMPIYEYTCQKCGRHLEVMQKMSDKPLT